MADRWDQKKTRDETFSSLKEIFGNIEKVIDYLVAKRKEDADVRGILAGSSVWFIGAFGLIPVDILTYNYVTNYFLEHPGSNLIYLGFLLVLSLPIGLITAFYARRRYVAEFMPWKKTLDELRSAIAENNAGDASVLEKTLQMVNQTSGWLPKFTGYKSGEALIYGILAWFIAAAITFPSQTLIVFDMLIGVIVWLYFRYEKRKEADEQMKKIEGWKQKLEGGESDFLNSV